jgi:hypothetical protein
MGEYVSPIGEDSRGRGGCNHHWGQPHFNAERTKWTQFCRRCGMQRVGSFDVTETIIVPNKTRPIDPGATTNDAT